MRIHRCLGIILFAFILSACGPSKEEMRQTVVVELTAKAPTTTPTKRPTIIPTPTISPLKSYAKIVLPHLKRTQSNLDVFTGLAGDAAENPYLFLEDRFGERMVGALDGVLANLNEIVTINPPPQAASIYEDFTKARDEFSKARDHITKALINVDEDELGAAVVHVDQFYVYFNLASDATEMAEWE